MGRAAATALAAFGLAAAGCGADDAAQETLDPVAKAADRATAAGGARIDGAARFKVDGRRFELRMTGTADFDDERSHIRMWFPAFSAREQREAGLPIERLRDGLVVYATGPDLRRRVGRHWAKVDLEERAEGIDIDEDALAGWDETNPQQLLDFLQAAGGARKAGAEQIGGVRTTRYDATVEVERYADHLLGDDVDEEARQGFITGLLRGLGATSIPVSVWLDDDGLIRRERMTIPVEIAPGKDIDARMVFDFKDFGPHHDVPLPDDADVEDITGEFEQYREYFAG
jgi:hypothetical protein